jgi:hypothetical protein
MLRQISLVLSFLVLGVFCSAGILSAVDTKTGAPAATDQESVTAAAVSSDTNKEPEAEAPAETVPQGISVKDLDAGAKPEMSEQARQDKHGSSQETNVAPDNEGAVGNLSAESVIVQKNWTIDGKIVGDKDKKMIIASGDTVYVDIGNDRVNNGDICVIYRKIGKVKDRGEDGGTLGYEVRRIGKIRITDNSNSRASSAKVILSYEPINIGDSVRIVQTEE